MASASGRAVGSDDSVLETRLSKEDGGRTFDFNGTRMNNSKQSSSSNTDDGSDSDSSSTNNSTSSIDESSSGDTANSVDDDVSVTPESDDDESEPTGAMAPAATDAVNGLIGSEVGTYVHRVLERPKVMPSDHPNKVHDWSGWPKFPPKAKPDLKRSVIKPTRLPRIIHVNSHEFRPIMELQINIHGRFMQPAPSIQLSHLMDDLQYTVWLTFTDVKDGRCAGQYSHPESPRPGSSWNGKVVSFDQVKLFSDEGYGQQPGPPVHSASAFVPPHQLDGRLAVHDLAHLHGVTRGRMRWPVHPSGISPSGLLLERQGGLLRSAEAVLQRWNHTPPTAHHPEEQHHLPHTSEHWSRQRQRTHPKRHSRPPVRRWHLLRGRPDRQEVQFHAWIMRSIQESTPCNVELIVMFLL
ncbi:uncharacterized protein LOC119169388 isoform X4 [Rhipicephalus microplus]|uniref:uncharacterized protein LOC119169388 isoform X4 n=1 Tax=Rhipicephalus microplus TaxID=6941 RepID=UPI003F6AAD78